MRRIAMVTMAAVLMSGVADAHTVNADAEAASTLLMLVAYSKQPPAAVVSGGDLSRSPEQIRRATLATRHRQHAASFRIAVQKPPM